MRRAGHVAAQRERQPRARVGKSTSSRIRRSATMLNSLLGISMPTALLPGIGASIRMRAGGEGHREVVGQGLDPADLDVRRRAGPRTGSRPGPRCGRRSAPRCRSSRACATMIASFRAWSLLVAAAAAWRLAEVEQLERRQDAVDRARASAASRRVGDVVEDAAAPARGRSARRRRPAPRRRPCAAARSVARARARSRASRPGRSACRGSSSQAPVWPGDSAAATCGARPRRSDSATARRGRARRRRRARPPGPAGRGPRDRPRRRRPRTSDPRAVADAALRARSRARASAAAGRTRSAGRRRKAEQHDERPGVVRAAPGSRPGSARSGRRVEPSLRSTQLDQAEEARRTPSPIPRSVRPSGAPGSLPGPLDVPAGDAAARTAAASARSRTHGATVSRHQSVRLPCPGSSERDQRHGAEARAGQIPTSERTTSGDSPATAWQREAAASCAGAAGDGASTGAGVVRRAGRHALDLDHHGEDHRPALGLLVQEARDARP